MSCSVWSSSEETISELETLQKPTFKLTMNKEFKHFYQEYEITFNNHLITIVVFYKNSDDSFNISFKINPDKNFSIITIVSLVYFEEDLLNIQTSL